MEGEKGKLTHHQEILDPSLALGIVAESIR